ncbi:MAG: hypothetical protein A3K10_13770 [Bacteroidetes bacterium RIFCSPLOWO2_12_FULL_31_6]|nr:MAG: hypothetical protein A3K10_13770 [Bacteroidetes bacterium RIFCSPLOWO2_12_FULL_31_6]
MKIGNYILLISLTFLFFSNPIFAEDRVEQALQKIKNLPDSQLAYALLDSAHAVKFIDFALSIQFAEKSLVYSKRSKDYADEANAYNVIGICHHLQGKYQIAFNYYTKALDLFTKHNFTRGQGSSLINLGVLYTDQEDYKTSIKYYLKAKKCAEIGKDSVNISTIYNNIAINYQKLNLPDTAIYYYTKSLEIREKLKRNELIAVTISNIATLYSDNKEYEKALAYHLISLKYDSLTTDKRNLVLTLNNISSTYASLKSYDKALEMSLDALKVAQELKYTQMYPDVYYNLFHIYFYRNDYKNAFDYAREYISIKDSLSTVESKEIIMEMQAKYDSELKEGEILTLNSKNELQQHKITQQRNFTYFLIVLAFLMLLIIFIAVRASKQKTKANQLISNQNAELTNQKKEIQEKSNVIELKSNQLQTALVEIKDSINYAKKIQEAILPKSINLAEFNERISILYLPKDVVSGDFYWFEKVGNKIILAVADCTGHGVPGAFMSMIGVNNLNQIIVENKITSPDKILKKLNIAIKKVLKQEDEGSESKDGMDIAISCFDLDKKTISYAGAFRPLLYIRNNELHELKGSRQPIGGSAPIDFDYELHQFKYLKDDVYYLFSDGFPDQFGGTKSKKFMTKQLKDTFMEIHQHSPAIQKELLTNELTNWRGDNEQIDDVLVMCVKI